MMKVKTCTRCNFEQSIDEFYKDKHNSTGYKPHCKKCEKAKRILNRKKHNQYQKSYYEKNKDLVKARHHKNYLDNKDNHLARNKANRLANPERANERARNWRKNNPEKAKASWEKHRLKYPEKNRAKVQVYRLKRIANGVYKISEKEILKLYNSNCFYCGASEFIQIDHIIPISKGGRHSIGNLVPACRTCNLRKRDKWLSEWRLLSKLN